ncbi:pre-mRNA-splicing factor ISY1 homolog [Cyclospora cayetanensis]|uniref:Pre-mRNA-splicing factor ISY1 homolog n=1 Tax=Cyclospora cayetanensis TaxID=88456 RepID=A0A6P6RR61_9EIME|nr:pre-mRNA-splicing factor ISY1 homolog [Cyclospora cayetanensis]
MARNAERANAVLNKWLAVKNAVLKGGQQKALGPCIPEECDDIERATQWRSQLVREIGRGISMIQDASLGEHRIRDLNDEINKKLRVKRRWEYRIKELGGADYSTASDALSLSGVAAAGGDYYYFGAAKELPGVRELFAAKAEEVNEPRKTRAQLLRRITPDYFGWRDEENEDLLLAEQQQEQLWHQEQQEELKQQQELLERVGAASAADVAVGIAAAAERERTTAKHKKDDQVETRTFAQDNNSSSSKKFRVYVDLPTDAEIARLLLEKKKQLIVQKYASVQAQQEEQETRRLVAPPD